MSIQWKPISTFNEHPTQKWSGYNKLLLLYNDNEVVVGYPEYDHTDEGFPIHVGWKMQCEHFDFYPTHWAYINYPT